MKASELLVEKIIELVNPKDRKEYQDVVWPMLHQTYKSVDREVRNSIQNLIQTPGVWKLIRQDGEIIGGVIYRILHGRKLRLVFHNGTQRGKKEMIWLLTRDMLNGAAWGELSGPLAKILLSAGCNPLSNKLAGKILNLPIKSLSSDGIHYTREVAPGEFKEEVILGYPSGY